MNEKVTQNITCSLDGMKIKQVSSLLLMSDQELKPV